MNEIYVTAVGSIKEITSDAVFYTPHTVSHDSVYKEHFDELVEFYIDICLPDVIQILIQATPFLNSM